MSNLCLPCLGLSLLYLLQLKKGTDISSFLCFVWQPFIYFKVVMCILSWSSYTQLIQFFLVGLASFLPFHPCLSNICSKWPESNNVSPGHLLPHPFIVLPIFVQFLSQHRLVQLVLWNCILPFQAISVMSRSFWIPLTMNNCVNGSQSTYCSQYSWLKVSHLIRVPRYFSSLPAIQRLSISLFTPALNFGGGVWNWDTPDKVCSFFLPVLLKTSYINILK